MAINIPIISSLDTKGFDKAKKEFSQLEGVGAKSAFALQKAALPAAAAIGALGAAAFGAAKGAIEDAAAQELLAAALKKNTGATKAQIAANEEFITAMGRTLGVTDTELRPAIAKLATQTKNLEEAQKGVQLAMDISAATGKPLSEVTDALAKAYGGNTKALAKLSPELKGLITDGLDAEGAMAKLADTFGGAATTKAGTAEGQFNTLKVSLDETKESIGEALLPAIEKVLPKLKDFADWAADNETTFTVIAATIAGIAAAVLLVNGAMAVYNAVLAVSTAAQWLFNTAVAANPIVLIGLAIVALIAGIVLAYNKFESFKNVVDTVGRALKTGFLVALDAVKLAIDGVATVFKTLFNGIAKLWNNTIGKLSFKVPDWVPKFGGKGFDVPDIPMLAEGGIVTGPTLAMIGERGPEAVIPLDRYNGGGGGNVTINVNGADPQAVVNALRTYMFRNGSVPIRVS